LTPSTLFAAPATGMYDCSLEASAEIAGIKARSSSTYTCSGTARTFRPPASGTLSRAVRVETGRRASTSVSRRMGRRACRSCRCWTPRARTRRGDGRPLRTRRRST
jgi:hypothetical protein